MHSLSNRAVLFFAIPVLMLCFGSLHAQRTPSQPLNRGIDIEVRVTIDDRPAPEQIRVQLLSGTSAMISMQFTRDQGTATFRGVSAGNYRLKVTGLDIEDAETSFSVDPREQTHMEYVSVRSKPKTAQNSNEGSISASTLNIPDKARKEFEKGASAMEKNDFAEAQKHFSKAVEIYPQYASAINNLGVIAMKSGDAALGRQLFDRAVLADSSNANAYLNVARCLLMEKKFAEAEPILLKASNLAPLDAEPLTLLANAQFAVGHHDLALMNAVKVHSLEHQRFSIVHLIAARVFESQKKLKDAADQYRLFLKESPASASAESARASLQALENHVK